MNLGGPVVGAARGDVLVDVPEGAVVNRVDRHAAVVAPAAETRQLRTGAFDDAGFSLHLAQSVARHPASEANRGMQVVARDAVAERDVARLVHGDRAHPAIVPITGRESLLLVHGG